MSYVLYAVFSLFALHVYSFFYQIRFFSYSFFFLCLWEVCISEGIRASVNVRCVMIQEKKLFIVNKISTAWLFISSRLFYSNFQGLFFSYHSEYFVFTRDEHRKSTRKKWKVFFSRLMIMGYFFSINLYDKFIKILVKAFFSRILP